MQATTTGTALGPAEIQGLSGEERKIARRCVSILGGLSAGSMLGVAFSLYLVNHHPLLLVALSPIGRHLILVAPSVDPVAFVLVAVARRMLFYLACFHLGRALGPRGLVWLEARAARFARFVRWLERIFSRASVAVVLSLPGPTVSALAGISGMRPRVFAPLAATGLVLRMLLVLAVASWLREPIEELLAWIEAWWIPGTVVLAAGVGVHAWRRRAEARTARAAEPEVV
jgi:membrane protein DedA with SNARE-associated domain